MLSRTPIPDEPPRISRWMWPLVICLGLCLFLHQKARGQDVVVLRDEAVLTTAGNVLLKDVAQISGPGALVLGELLVGSVKAENETSISIDALRVMLEREHKVNMGRVLLSGANVKVRLKNEAVARAIVKPQEVVGPVQAEVSGPTIRTAVLAALASHAGASEADLRTEFGAKDETLLDTAVLDGQVVSVIPTAKSSEVPLSVRVYAGDQLVSNWSMRVKLSIRRQVLVATRDIDRGAAIDSTNTRVEERWLTFTNLHREAQALAGVPDEGAVAKQAMKASQVIGSRHVALPLLIEKGDVVAVDCVRNGIVVRASLRAKSDGKLHEVIEFTPLASHRSAKDRREKRELAVIHGRVVGAGRAVMLLAGDPGAEPAKNPETTRVAVLEEVP